MGRGVPAPWARKTDFVSFRLALQVKKSVGDLKKPDLEGEPACQVALEDFLSRSVDWIIAEQSPACARCVRRHHCASIVMGFVKSGSFGAGPITLNVAQNLPRFSFHASSQASACSSAPT